MVVSVNQQLKNHEERLNNQIKRRIVTKEEELKKLDNFFKDKARKIRQDGDTEAFMARVNARDELQEAISATERKLKDAQKRIKEQEQSLNKEFSSKKIEKEKKLKAMAHNFNQKFQDSFRRGNLKAEEINTANANFIKKVKANAATQQTIETKKTRRKLNSKIIENEEAVKKQQKDHEKRLERSGKLLGESLTKARLDHRKEVTNIRLNNKIRQEQLKKTNDFIIKKESDQHKNILNNEKAAFNRKYNFLKDSHDKIIKEIKFRNEKELKGIIRSFEEAKASIIEKSKDTFYRVRSIEPVLLDSPKEYKVNVKVPPYEKDTVTLTGHGRSIKVSQSRRFSDQVEAPDGSVNKSRRSEIFTKEFSTKEIIDSNSIKSSYKDGILTFYIKKA